MVRHTPVLSLQWIDSKPVTILTTLFSANEEIDCQRRMKQDGNFQNVTNGVDRSDQMLACHNVSQKCYRWWKILFFHPIDIAIVNGFLLFQQYRSQNPDIEALQRSNRYNISDFREALVRKNCGWPEYDTPPVYVPASPRGSQFETLHILHVSEDTERNCGVCYKEIPFSHEIQSIQIELNEYK